MINCPLEKEEAISLIEWARYHPIVRDHLIHHVNEGKRTAWYGKQKQKEGMRRGISDYFLAYPSNSKYGLWIELKRRNRVISKLTEEQAIWLARMERTGYATGVAYGWEHAVEIIERYLK